MTRIIFNCDTRDCPIFKIELFKKIEHEDYYKFNKHCPVCGKEMKKYD